MKKLIAILTAVFCVMLSYAESSVLLKSDAVADLDTYDYVSNFEISSSSGYFTKNDLQILKPNEHGFRFMASNVPATTSTHYEIYPSYPSFLNEAGIGAGRIDNAGSIKTITVVGMTNRPYDEVVLLYSTSATGEIKSIKMPQDFDTIRSMEEFTLVFDNPLYENDVNKRTLSSKAVVGSDATAIYLRGIQVRTNAPSGFNAYSSYSIMCIKEISVTYDKVFTDEQLALRQSMKDEFGIHEDAAATDAAKAKVGEKIRLRTNEEALKDGSNIESAAPEK